MSPSIKIARGYAMLCYAMLLGSFPATVIPSKLYAHFKFNIN